MSGDVVTVRTSNEQAEAIERYGERHDITTTEGEVSVGKATLHAAEKTLTAEGLWDGDEVSPPFDAAYEAGKICFGVSIGLLIAELVLPAAAPLSFFPHIVGFLVAGSVAMWLDRAGVEFDYEVSLDLLLPDEREAATDGGEER